MSDLEERPFREVFTVVAVAPSTPLRRELYTGIGQRETIGQRGRGEVEHLHRVDLVREGLCLYGRCREAWNGDGILLRI